jgi:hypothetical protein
MEDERPASVVDGRVVRGADEDELVEVRRAGLVPWWGVVGDAPLRSCCAARPTAPAVTRTESPTLGAGRVATGPPVVEGDPGRVRDQPGELRLTDELLQRLGWARSGPRQRPRGSPGTTLDRLGGDEHVDLRRLATVVGKPTGAHRAVSQGDESVGASLAGRAVILVAVPGAQGVDGGEQLLAPELVETTLQEDAPLAVGRQVERALLVGATGCATRGLGVGPL